MNTATESSNTSSINADSRLAFDLRTLASLLGCSIELLRKEIRRNRLRPSRLGRRIVVARSEVDRYLEATQVGIR
jgi:excisionase family DNA binding protein